MLGALPGHCPAPSHPPKKQPQTDSLCLLRVKPSETCGPFQGLQTIYQTLKVWVELLEESNPNIAWFSWIPQYLVENTIFLFFLTGVVL